jgi:predicted PurR-regulated permease PerM
MTTPPRVGALGPLAGFVLVLVAMLALREVASLIVPALFGLFLALVTMPMVGALERRGVGRSAAAGIAILVILVLVLLTAGLIILSIAELVVEIPKYEDRFAALIESLRTFLAGLGIAADPKALVALISTDQIVAVLRPVASGAASAAAAILILAFTLIYAITGARGLQGRAEVVFGERHALLDGVERFGLDLRRYLLVRAQLGLFAAVLVLVLLVVLGVPFPALWAFLVFAASFIPNIGTFIALIPPTILALLDSGPAQALAVLIGFTLVNFAQDYLLQPRIMGIELNLSPLVVFLSVIAWAWILGAAGALLAVPLTVGLVAILEASPTTRPIAALLRNEIEPPADPTPVTS